MINLPRQVVPPSIRSTLKSVAQAEKEAIEAVFTWNPLVTIEELVSITGVPKATLYEKFKVYGMPGLHQRRREYKARRAA